jgi:glycosyltransferase involved in cell wall biosynthesis
MATLVLVGDGPLLQTGLARISRDLAARIVQDFGTAHQFVHVGLSPRLGQQWRQWPLWGFTDVADDWGAKDIATNLGEVCEAAQPPVAVLLNWDAARCAELLPYMTTLPVASWWAYPPLDAAVQQETLTGPPARLIRRLDRVLAYGRWASTILRNTQHAPCAYLPHGLEEHWFAPRGSRADARASLSAILDGAHVGPEDVLIGCVAANQPRKDLGLFIETLAALRDRGVKVRGWLHVDKPVTEAWSVPQLIEDAKLKSRVIVTSLLTDEELGFCYRACDVTFAPGRGEGFGYPIVESLACGTPVVHADACGGAELVPVNAWRVPVRTWRTEGTFGVRRPILAVDDVVNAVERARQDAQEPDCADYCRGSVEHLRWTHLWPRWRAWIRQGLEAL